jgi:hypothetical protein
MGLMLAHLVLLGRHQEGKHPPAEQKLPCIDDIAWGTVRGTTATAVREVSGQVTSMLTRPARPTTMSS